jgi:hypothetical protein
MEISEEIRVFWYVSGTPQNFYLSCGIKIIFLKVYIVGYKISNSQKKIITSGTNHGAGFNILTDEEKITYLSERLNRLGEMIVMMEPKMEYRARTVNLTWEYSRKEEKIVRYMFSASVRCGRTSKQMIQINAERARNSRVNTMRVLQWTHIALTPEQLKLCKHPLGNCSESVPWEALCGEMNCVVLFSRTLILPKKVGQPLEIKRPCILCQIMAETMSL